MITIIVPCYNERYLIERKIDNLLFNYPVDKMEIVIVDGGSTDGSFELAKEKAEVINLRHNQKILNLYNAVTVYKSEKGKTRQLNYGLSKAHGEIIFVTDVDAVMDKGCISQIMRFFSDEKVGVVGAWTLLKDSVIVDKCYWYVANWIRYLESKFISASHVVAPCYAFRKNLLERLPDDVVADDVHISMVASFKGLRIKYVKSAVVYEIRSPMTLAQFYHHKMRKGRAFLKELLRFIYLIPTVRGRQKIIYLLRLIQFTLLTPTVFVSYFFKNDNSCYPKTGK